MADKKKDYPIRIKLKPPVPAKRNRESKGSNALLKGAVERGNREQAREAEDLRTMNMKKKPMSKFAMGGSVKGSGMKKKSIDGCAAKGKTRAKMVKMVKMAEGGKVYKRGGKTSCK